MSLVKLKKSKVKMSLIWARSGHTVVTLIAYFYYRLKKNKDAYFKNI